MREEIGAGQADILAESRGWFHHDVPDEIAQGKMGGTELHPPQLGDLEFELLDFQSTQLDGELCRLQLGGRRCQFIPVVGDAGLGKLILDTASILVIEFGATAVGHGGDVRELALNSSWEGPASSGSSQHPQVVANLSKDDVRQGQLELRHAGLYSGSLDGVIGPQAKQALVQLQKDNGLEQTGTFDGRTMVMMFGNVGTSEGSSMPPNASQATGQ